MLLFSSVCSFFWSPFRVARWRTLLGFCICAVACTSCSVDKHMERKTVELMDKMAAIPKLGRTAPEGNLMGYGNGRHDGGKFGFEALGTGSQGYGTFCYQRVYPGHSGREPGLDADKRAERADRVTAQDVEYNIQYSV